MTLTLGVLFLLPFLFFLLSLYINITVDVGGITPTAFITGYCAGFILSPRLVFTGSNNSNGIIRSGVFIGAICLLGTSLFVTAGNFFFFNIYPNIYNYIVMVIDRNLIFDPYGVSPLLALRCSLLLPLWGLFGWLAHRWFYQRQHNFWSQNLTVFE